MGPSTPQKRVRTPPPPPSPSSCCSQDSPEDWELISFPSSTTTTPKVKQKDTPPSQVDITFSTSTTLRLQQQLEPTAPIMPGWKDDYIAALVEAEKNNPVNAELVDACSHLNARIAALEAEKAQQQWQQPTQHPPQSPSSNKPTPTPSATDPTKATDTTTLRTSLAKTLLHASTLETRLRQTTTERDRLASLTKSQSRTNAVLAAENKTLSRKVRDQAEELEGKKQLLDRMHDDVLALELNVSLVEQQKAKLAADNKDLVERWMRRVKVEAEKMNAGNERGGGAS